MVDSMTPLSVGSQLWRLRYGFRSQVAKYPELFFPLVKLRGQNNHLMPSKQTRVVIEGFPRSANTFAVAAFQFAQPKSIHIARHLHASAQLVHAVRKRLPMIVLIRNPDDAIVSFKLRYSELNIRQAFEDYVRFYTVAKKYQDHFVLGHFEQVTSDYSRVIEALNQKFDTSFMVFEHSQENVKDVFEVVDEMDRQDTGRFDVTENKVARPSSLRNELKTSIQLSLEHESLMDIRKRARDLYFSFSKTP